MNVYLAFSMTLSAAVEGIKKKIHPGKATDQDLYNMTEKEFKKLGIKRLPRNLLMALEALKNDTLSDEVIGSVMKKSLLAYKSMKRVHNCIKHLYPITIIIYAIRTRNISRYFK